MDGGNFLGNIQPNRHTDKIYLDLPAGDYKLEYWWDGDEDKANDGWVSLVFNGETLVDELEIYDNEEFTITDTFEDIVVEANSSTEVEWTIMSARLTRRLSTKRWRSLALPKRTCGVCAKRFKRPNLAARIALNIKSARF